MANEGSTVQYIDDIFEASDGTASDNLINKGQCMALLLYTYLSGGTIQANMSYTVRQNKYSLKRKESKLFEKLPPPNSKLADVIKSMKGGGGSTMIIASIKNLHIFLETIKKFEKQSRMTMMKVLFRLQHLIKIKSTTNCWIKHVAVLRNVHVVIDRVTLIIV